ncbi:MAG TPA: MerR family transcriptional regulator [Pseudomonas sp.]|nr:MerR family transcriptional regulator [Pseudomonas sp.]
MRIGELARHTGLAASRIRFYESEGLISAVKRTANGYREYSKDAQLLLIIITRAQGAGFTLEEIRQLLPTDPGVWAYDALVDALKRKVSEIEALELRLQQNRTQLLATIASIENKPQDVACGDNARRMLDSLQIKQIESLSGSQVK